MRIVSLDEIKTVIKKVDLMAEIEKGFSAYSNGMVIVPPVGELNFDSPPGDVHIKYGYIKDDDIYVIKIASGFYNNNLANLPTGNGMMLVFSQKTGELISILNDECYLTDIRTAIAGAIAAKYLAPKKIDKIGIVGTGAQAKLQLAYLDGIVDCKEVIVWGRNSDSTAHYKEHMKLKGYHVDIAKNIDNLVENCQLIVTCTASKSPLIDYVKPGTHITAMGSDTLSKQELASNIILESDLVVTDSRQQSNERGEIYQSLKDGFSITSAIEIGEIISGRKNARSSDSQVTVADLTGVAVQDIQISKAILNNL